MPTTVDEATGCTGQDAPPDRRTVPAAYQATQLGCRMDPAVAIARNRQTRVLLERREAAFAVA
ncbi:hypothetical protein GCM10010405_44000 [Streptomyces macrosporus]|uniref:Uncharacterized protein n=1 Tax=Streptomyces macrosporus TaxID=44032 RepID=A0ABN3KCP6_9ACTN